MTITVDVSGLTDTDLTFMALTYARLWSDEQGRLWSDGTAPQRLRNFWWSMSVALTEERERREEALQAASDDLDDAGGKGELVT